MCTEDRYPNLDLASTRPFPEDSSFTIIYEGPQNEFHVKSLPSNEQHWFRVRACSNNIMSRWCNKTLSVKTKEERGFSWDRAASHKETVISMEGQRVQRSPSSSHWVCAFGNKAFNLKRRYATIKVSGDSPYLYVGVAYKGAPVAEAYNNVSVLWRKGSGDLCFHGVRLNRSKLPSVSSASGELCYGGGDVVGIMVDVKLGKVAFFCNGVLARTASGLRTDVDVLPFVSLGSADVVAEFTTESFIPTTPRDFSSQRRLRS
ncbi:hypothetical protein GUITHDRAFT_154501 [Guillardia theta CCMP2712]|uniref:B30.2/SPRY domain-containing protein n=2 Tax=Guillardia theta TaxID=55529 RepID=L1IT76_GUITC|nr:hypothetical protein GUITHDRAFT_154501 [Guillardia theta CCMP2712]EKX39277.1 hypothetical protein GUITHDRAFT_154501 [Guillardia theta CCMP2712]|mmetsp:Transcript_19144/g.63155  ORF Transcript_19144/g.63155 Transcript_19144/m.63155 type:complete len:260 (-) Transcript_19144:79-858(-)|eukprot:XP_005826257.1 hypothetical protein GUITHDRAFT_154501 [Guillardia theta CCMP2712]